MNKEKFEKKVERMKERKAQTEILSELSFHKFETSKLIACYLFIILNIIIVYSLAAMWHFGDLSYLGVLITDIAAQIITYAIYCLKAYNGKKSEEEIKLERYKFDNDSGDCGDG